jgi:DNA (cytosine-5)-methyltransferase 1
MRRVELPDGDRAFLRARRGPPLWSVRAPGVRVVDLFAGCGGLSLGVREACRAAGRPVEFTLAVEASPAAAALYARNLRPVQGRCASLVSDWFGRRIGGAVSSKERVTRKLVGGHVDLLVGGPPCQGHSSLNNHTRNDDPKNALYLSMVRAAEVLEPNAVLIENVPSLPRDAGGVLDRAIVRLEKLGYCVEHEVVPLHLIGVPQTRKRHILVARCEGPPGLRAAIDAGRLHVPRSLRWAIWDLRNRCGGPLVKGSDIFDKSGTLSPENHSRAMWLLRNHQYDLPNRLRPPCHRDKPDHKYWSMYGRLNWDAPAHTITSGFTSPGQGRYLHPDQPRTLSPHEAARLQFFPDWFDFSGVRTKNELTEIIGNAVPSKLSFLLARHLLGLDASRPTRQFGRATRLAAAG